MKTKLVFVWYINNLLGRKDVPNVKLPHLNQEKLHLLTTESFLEQDRNPITMNMHFDFKRNLSRYNVDYYSN